jgi:hypothetical protein
MKKTLVGITAGGCALAVLVAAPAQASESSYLRRVQDTEPVVYQKYSNQALLNEGYKICTYEAAGMSTSDETDRIVSEMPMSRGAAIEFQVLATVHLGC